ncbi:MAG TPA: S46 family peptidase [Thermoanaerobaculia bacterium]|nr:S46 family peptidase [Thermoanaerobaculia bacterium]
MKRPVLSLCLVLSAVLAAPLVADEGMWPYNNVPVKQLQAKYGWAPDQAWLDHVRLASVRFNSGGSGSFVSDNGLVLTNHHVGAGCIQKISTPEKDYIKNGYVAKSAAEEVKCPDLELNVLEGIEDVTAKVNAEVKPGMAAAEVLASQKAVQARLEKECNEFTGLRCNTITLYAGGEYDLYKYKKYTDVRLVVAPEFGIAFFGGDPDNFTYPRWDIDFALFRVYENDKPVRPKHFLKWNPAGPKENELVIVSGNPGSTARLDTLAQIEFDRDVRYPAQVQYFSRRAALLHEFSNKSPENARMANRSLFGVENSLKRYRGYLQAVQDPKVVGKKAEDEKALKARVAADAKLAAYAGAWDAIAAGHKAYAKRYERDTVMTRALTTSAPQMTTARTIVRYVVEKEKPNDKRIEEFRDSNLKSLEFALYSPAPIYPALEKVTLADSFRELSEKLGATDPFVQKVLAGKTPEARAAELVEGTKLKDVAFRRELVAGGVKAVEESTDSLIVLARQTEAELREIRKWREENVESVDKANGALIARALFAVAGKDQYPDATFTLRLAFGPAKGYVENGQTIPFAMTWSQMYEHSEKHAGKSPYDLPKSYLDVRGKVDGRTPVNFVATADTTGGNSGSPAVNEKGELIGLAFDGNIQSLGNDVVYSDQQARSVFVHTAAMTTALRQVYDAGTVADELEKATTASAGGSASGDAKAQPK